MKKLILLSIASAVLVSCGKNINPPPVDYNDDDGDQILNYLETSERDKYVSNFQQITAKEASITLRLKNLAGDLKIIETTLEFNKDIRGELTKEIFKNFDSPIIQYSSDYFSEFATAKILPSSKKVQLTELATTDGEIEIIFDNEGMHNDNISAMRKIDGKYEEIFSGLVNKKSLKVTGISNKVLLDNILNSNEIYFINNSHFSNRKSVYDKTLTEDLKKKTYRLIVSTPVDTNFYYISTALSIQGFLDLEKIDISQSLFRSSEDYIPLYGDTHAIDDKNYIIPLNFTPVSMNSKIQEGMTYALYIGKASTIKKDYFKSFLPKTETRARTAQQPLEVRFHKNNTKEIIIDFDFQKNQSIFSKVSKRYHSNLSGASSYIQYCSIDVIESTGTFSLDANILSQNDLGLSFSIDGRSVNPTQEINIEQNGKIIKRMIFRQNGENIIAHFSAPRINSKYGCVKNGCQTITNDYPSEYENCQLSETTDELNFSVTYQAYIE